MKSKLAVLAVVAKREQSWRTRRGVLQSAEQDAVRNVKGLPLFYKVLSFAMTATAGLTKVGVALKKDRPCSGKPLKGVLRYLLGRLQGLQGCAGAPVYVTTSKRASPDHNSSQGVTGSFLSTASN